MNPLQPPSDISRHTRLKRLIVLGKYVRSYVQRRFYRMLVGVSLLVVLGCSLAQYTHFFDFFSLLDAEKERNTVAALRFEPRLLGSGHMPVTVSQGFSPVTEEQLPAALAQKLMQIVEPAGIRLLGIYTPVTGIAEQKDAAPLGEYLFLAGVKDSERRYVLPPEFERLKDGMRTRWEGRKKGHAEILSGRAEVTAVPGQTVYCVLAESDMFLTLLETTPLVVPPPGTGESLLLKVRSITQFRLAGQRYFMLYSGTVAGSGELQQFTRRVLGLLRETGLLSSDDAKHILRETALHDR